MPYACMRKTIPDGDIDVPVVTEPQPNGHISPRTPCICPPYAG